MVGRIVPFHLEFQYSLDSAQLRQPDLPHRGPLIAFDSIES